MLERLRRLKDVDGVCLPVFFPPFPCGTLLIDHLHGHGMLQGSHS